MKKTIVFVLVFTWLLHTSIADMTGVHYLFTNNCSSANLYIPQGPYLFSHHWPFTSISVDYGGQTTLGSCFRDGSLYFSLNDGRFCSGLYFAGQAKLVCRLTDSDFCSVQMKTSDGQQLKCSGTRRKPFALVVMVVFLLLCF